MTITPNIHSLRFDKESSYLITGGLGGLGKILITWMAERGARNFVLISRSAGLRDTDQEFIEEMKAQGCLVLAVTGQVQNKDDVLTAIGAAQKPIRGVFHLAMVLRDAQILDMTFKDWEIVISTKCAGAWNLHEALQSQPLDFFILASSIVANVESAGQSNYCAANTFLEAFCQYRHSLGLPASVIGISPIDDVGFHSGESTARKTVNAQGLAFLSQKEFLDYVELAVLNSHPELNHGGCKDIDQIDEKLWNPIPVWHSSANLIMGLKSVGPLSDPKTRTSWRQDRRMGFYHNLRANTDSEKPNASQLAHFIIAAYTEPNVLKSQHAVEFLATEIGKRIFSLMLRDEKDVSLEMEIRDIGLDSLMAIGIETLVVADFQSGSQCSADYGVGKLVELGELAAKGLIERLSAEERA